ncbi:non-homologous end-joining DNA ligase [Luteipulveratus mongoliensis]|uniref:DNA ligase (ATP) n=1 Tax=Luteipulveratus mongoliensis TaxID=571913 RepID=A0A0K1JMU3_9MICO|nr:non-homologous end-joining DNA ligase [Luteipulveratus mongoliensis]AKU18039.1 DNA ligase [Luteipulveratus mongoliensis]
MRPMLATPSDRVPTGEGWCHEVKWDGFRVLVEVKAGSVRVASRTDRDVTIAFPELAREAAGLTAYDDLLLDGELVVMREGLPSFKPLAERFNVTNPRVADELAVTSPVTLMVFDVLRVMGTPVTSRPLRERRQLLEGAGLGSPWVQVPPTFDDGATLLAATGEQGMEGVVSKRWTSTYTPGRRSADWLKIVNRHTGSYVIGGWRYERESRDRLGAVLLGTPTPAGVIFRGRMGSGLAGKTGANLLPQLQELPDGGNPFVDEVPREDQVGTTWVEPTLVVDVEHHGHADTGRLRQPSWRGVRHDLTVEELMRTDTTDA